MHQIRFRLGLDPLQTPLGHWGSLQRSPYPTWILGVLLLNEARGGADAKKERYDTRCYFNVRSKADISQLNLPHGTDN